MTTGERANQPSLDDKSKKIRMEEKGNRKGKNDILSSSHAQLHSFFFLFGNLFPYFL